MGKRRNSEVAAAKVLDWVPTDGCQWLGFAYLLDFL